MPERTAFSIEKTIADVRAGLVSRDDFIRENCDAALPSDTELKRFYALGRASGREQALREIDQLTGGTGDFQFKGDVPDMQEMKDRIFERFEARFREGWEHATESFDVHSGGDGKGPQEDRLRRVMRALNTVEHANDLRDEVIALIDDMNAEGTELARMKGAPIGFVVHILRMIREAKEAEAAKKAKSAEGLGMYGLVGVEEDGA